MDLTGIAGLAGARTQSAPATLTKNPESLLCRLQQIDAVLRACEDRIVDISGKYTGMPSGEDSNKAPAQPGVSGLVMQVNSRAQRLLDALNAVSNEIG
jgi:hypothetical protein